MSSYDVVPYSSNPFPQTHPDRLATVATLFSLAPPPLDRCRVLELGCGRGGNLLPMAERFPDSEFLGVDLSQVQIAEAAQLAQDVELSNIRFRHADILELGSELPDFDYIIVHGVYSWVPRRVQDKILTICKHHLSGNGVAYVSYNTYPGWKMRGMVRDMACYHASRFDDPEDKIRQSRELLDFFAKHSPGNTPYGQFLKSEAEILRRHEDAYLFHEHLEDVNDPVYFHEFAERVQAKGLQYLGEADIGSMYNGYLPGEVLRTLERITSSLVQMEQYVDFLRNRMFRQTLLCHQAQSPDRTLGLPDIVKLYVCGRLHPAARSDRNEESQAITFQAPGVKVSVRHPLLQACLLALARIYPCRLKFDELIRQGREYADRRSLVTTSELETENKEMARELLSLFVSGAVQLHVDDGGFQRADTARPHAGRLAREQARRKQPVTSGQHLLVMPGELERMLLCELDGTHTREEIEITIRRWIDSGAIQLQSAGEHQASGDPVPAAINVTLERLARLGLLTEPVKRLERSVSLAGDSAQ